MDSRSEPTPHRINLCDYNFNGACDCAHFKFNCEPKLCRGWDPALSLQCWHIKRAVLFIWFEFGPKLAQALGDMPVEYSKP